MRVGAAYRGRRCWYFGLRIALVPGDFCTPGSRSTRGNSVVPSRANLGSGFVALSPKVAPKATSIRIDWLSLW